jgi:hypothetical protein
MSLDKRLERLEDLAGDASPTKFEDWSLDDQLEDVADKLDLYIRFHSRDTIRYQATDRELHLLGLLCAANELGAEGGEYTFPTGLTVGLARVPQREGDGFLIDAPRHIRADDLPEWTREHVERIDPKDQDRRDRWLYEMRHYFKRDREERPKREEERRRRSRESKQSDRELLERNRASVGLPPLTPEQIEAWGLQETEAP